MKAKGADERSPSRTIAYTIPFVYLSRGYRFADPAKAKGEDERAFAELFQDKCAGSLLEANIALLSQLKTGTVIPERVVNLSLHYLQYW